MANLDDEFKALAQQAAEEEASKAKRGSGGDFEVAKWTGLQKGKMKIIRALGGFPSYDGSPTKNNFDSRTIRSCHIKGDNGKQLRAILPLMDHSHILWRIIDRVMESEWGDDKKRHFIQEKKNPEIFNMVSKNNLVPGTPAHKMDRGWSGREYFVMNCIDREPDMYSWSKENKHAVLLSKNVTLGINSTGKNVEYAEEGIPAYGFTNLLNTNIFKYYGDWEKYDIGIEKLGQMQNPIKVINAVKHSEEVPPELQPFIVSTPLTEEEMSWVRYDLNKFFSVTSATKIFNRLKLSIKKIDVALGTHFEDELRSLVEEEAKSKPKNFTEEKAEEDKEVEIPFKEEDGTAFSDVKMTIGKPVTEQNETFIEVRTKEFSKAPKGYAILSNEDKVKISAFKQVGDTYEFSYNTPDSDKKARCPQCDTISPTSFKSCPNCGLVY
jgi:hypothetical protein